MISPISGAGNYSPIQNSNDPKQAAQALINKIEDEMNDPAGDPGRIIMDVNQLKKLESDFPKLKDQFDTIASNVTQYEQAGHAADPSRKVLCLDLLNKLSDAIKNS